MAKLAFFKTHFSHDFTVPFETPSGFSQLWIRQNDIMQCVCYGKESGFIERINAFTLKPDADYYISANTFSHARERKNEYIFSLRNIVIDIDAHSSSPDDISKLIERFLFVMQRDASAGAFPLPQANSMVLTGRGVQLWWAFAPISHKFLDIYDFVCKSYVDLFKLWFDEYTELSSLTLDSPSSLKAAGLFRMPQTFNTHTGSIGTVSTNHSERLNFFEEQTKLLKCGHKKTLKRPALPKSYDISDLGRKRVAAISKLVELRNNNVTGMRSALCMIYFNECLKFMSIDSSTHEVKRFNCLFRYPLSGTELRNAISAPPKAKSYIDRQIGYAFTNQYIIDTLNISIKEQLCIDLRAERKKPNHSRNIILAKRKKDKLMRNAKIFKLARKGLSKSKIARICKVHRNTVYNVLKKVGFIAMPGKVLKKSFFTPLHKTCSYVCTSTNGCHITSNYICLHRRPLENINVLSKKYLKLLRPYY